MLRIGYVGSMGTPEYATFVERNRASLSALYATEDAPVPEGVTPWGSPGELVASADLDAVVLAMPDDANAPLLSSAVDRGLPAYIVPAASGDGAAWRGALRKAADSDVTVVVSRPMRYAINLRQIRRTVMSHGMTSLEVSIVSESGGIDGLPDAETHLADVTRYVGGEVSEMHASCSVPGVLQSTVVLFESGSTGTVSVRSGWRNGGEFRVDMLSRGVRLGWMFGGNKIFIDGEQEPPSESVAGLHVANVAAFLTAVALNTRSPILSACEDELATLDLADALRGEWSNGISQEEGTA